MQTLRDTLIVLKPVIEERRGKMEEYGDNWAEKPVGLT